MDTSENRARGVSVYHVGTYDYNLDFMRRSVIRKKYGIRRLKKSSTFFDGMWQGTVVKINDMMRPLTGLDLQIIKTELIRLECDNPQKKPRQVTVFCFGVSDIEGELPDDRITIEDISREKIFESASGIVNFIEKGECLKVDVLDYRSPMVEEYFGKILDFRMCIDLIYFDLDYNYDYFNNEMVDRPDSQEYFIHGSYKIPLKRSEANVAVKIIDVFGEELVICRYG